MSWCQHFGGCSLTGSWYRRRVTYVAYLKAVSLGHRGMWQVLRQMASGLCFVCGYATENAQCSLQSHTAQPPPQSPSVGLSTRVWKTLRPLSGVAPPTVPEPLGRPGGPPHAGGSLQMAPFCPEASLQFRKWCRPGWTIRAARLEHQATSPMFFGTMERTTHRHPIISMKMKLFLPFAQMPVHLSSVLFTYPIKLFFFSEWGAGSGCKVSIYPAALVTFPGALRISLKSSAAIWQFCQGQDFNQRFSDQNRRLSGRAIHSLFTPPFGFCFCFLRCPICNLTRSKV